MQKVVRFHQLVPKILSGSNKYQNLCFEQKYKKKNFQNVSSESFHFLLVKFSIYLNRRVFIMLGSSLVVVFFFFFFFFLLAPRHALRDIAIATETSLH